MTTTNAKNKYIHPVLNELGLTLPMRQDACWALSRLDEEVDADARLPALRFTLAADNDLIVECMECARPGLRYVFDKTGRLVSIHRGCLPGEDDGLIKVMRKWAMTAIRSQLIEQRA